MSSTDDLSADTVHILHDERSSLSGDELSDDVADNKYKTDRRGSKSPNRASQETLIEIEELIDDIPQLGDIFTVSNKIGSGTFSSVYVAQLKQCQASSEKYALKHIIPTSHPSRIENELRCMQEIGGCDNVMGVKACIRERDHVVIVMPYFPHDRFQDYVQNVTVREVQDYMKNLLLALRRVHEVDIIHRDVKPTNFLFNRKLKRFALVDFGLAQKAPVPLRGNISSQNVSAKCAPSEAETTKAKDTQVQKVSRHQAQMPLSPKKTNIPPQTEIKASQSPRKRKMGVHDIENFPESPRKKRVIPGDQRQVTVGLVEIDQNIPKKEILTKLEDKSPVVKLHKVDSHHNVLTPPIGLDNPAYLRNSKSPRRALLTKRALDMQKVAEVKPAQTRVAGPSTSAALNRHQQPARKAVVVERNGKPMFKTVAPAACQCYGKALICSVCVARSNQGAPRAGTPGFRAPEVLMKCPGQTTAVDIWSAGVIFLSLLSGRYPFFKSGDDLTALAQIISVFGSDRVRTGAQTYGKNLTCNPETPGFNLKTLCDKLRGVSRSPRLKGPRLLSEKSGIKKQAAPFPDTAFHLLERLMDLSPSTRITAEDALNHPFFQDV